MMNKLKTALKISVASFAKDEKGNLAVMFAITAAALIGGLACSVDMTNAMSNRMRLQDTTDQIALLAAKDQLATVAELQAAAQSYFDLNFPDGQGDRIVLNSITRDGDTVTVDATNTVDTYFANIFGKPTLDVGVRSSAAFAERKINIALVLDTTGSMGETSSGKAGGTKLDSLKEAANNLVNKLETSSADDLEMSVVPFGQYVNVGTSNKTAVWLETPTDAAWSGCVGSRPSPWNERVEYMGRTIPSLYGSGINCGAAIQPLTQDMNTVKATIDSMVANGWTYIPSGLSWGWRSLTVGAPSSAATVDPKKETDKILVLMTDGKNTRSKSGVSHDTPNGYEANDTTKKMCSDVKYDGIKIYTIAYELNHNPTKNMLRACATQDDMFFEAKNASELNAAFDKIADNVTVLRLTN